MPGRRRVPMFALAGGLLALIVVLATLQYRWLGQISAAERERMSATLGASASAFAEDFDRELNRAYLLFQLTAPASERDGAAQVAERLDRWQSTSRFPRLVKDVFVASVGPNGATLGRFDPSSRLVEPVEWPAALAPIRTEMARATASTLPSSRGAGNHVFRGVPALWAEAPAVVVSAPMV